MIISHRARIVAAFAAIYLMWGGTVLAIRYAVADIPPLMTMVLRCAAGASLLFAWLAWRGTLVRPARGQWLTTGVAGVLLFLGCHGLLAWAEQRVTSGEAALFMTTEPLLLIALASALARQLPSSRVILALVLGIAGVGVLTWGEGWSGGLVDRGALVVSALFWAVGTLIVGREGTPLPAAQSTAMQLGAGAAALLVASLAVGELRGWSVAEVTPRAAAVARVSRGWRHGAWIRRLHLAPSGHVRRRGEYVRIRESRGGAAAGVGGGRRGTVRAHRGGGSAGGRGRGVQQGAGAAGEAGGDPCCGGRHGEVWWRRCFGKCAITPSSTSSTATPSAPPHSAPPPSARRGAPGGGAPASTGKPSSCWSRSSRRVSASWYVAAHAFAIAVMISVALRQLGELLREVGKEAVPRRGTEPERRPDHVAGTRLLRRRHEPQEALAVVGDAGDDRCEQQPRRGFPPRSVARAARIRADGTGERSSSRRASRGSSVAIETLTVTSLRSESRLEHVDVAGDQRRLGDDTDA